MKKHKALLATVALIGSVIVLVVCTLDPFGRPEEEAEATVAAGSEARAEPRTTDLAPPNSPADRQSASPATEAEASPDLPQVPVTRDRETIRAELRKAADEEDAQRSKRLMLELKLREFQEAPSMEKLDAAKTLVAMSIAEILTAQGRAWPSSKRRPQGGADWEGGERFFVYNGDAFYFHLDEFPEFGKIQEARTARREAQKQAGLGAGPLVNQASEEVYAAVEHRAFVAMDLLSD